MKRVLVYGMTSNNGGIEAYIMNYFSHFDREKLVFDFITDSNTIAWKDEIEKLGGKIFYIPARRENLIKHIKDIHKIIKDNNYDTVYYNLLSASGVFSVLASKGIKGVKTVVHSHNDKVGNMNVHLLLRPLLNKITNYKLACSDEAAIFMFSEKIFNQGKVKVINNAIDINKYSYNEAARKKIRKELNIENNFVIGHVGRMCYQKNSIFIIDIFNEVLKRKPNSKLLYIGDGEDRELVKNQVQKYLIQDEVIFTGMIDEVSEYYSAMDVFLLPSRFEGLGIVAVEAQVSGLPCFVSTNVNTKTNLTNHYTFISLNETAENWSTKIISADGIKRENNNEIISESGFEIDCEVKKLEEFFILGVR